MKHIFFFYTIFNLIGCFNSNNTLTLNVNSKNISVTDRATLLEHFEWYDEEKEYPEYKLYSFPALSLSEVNNNWSASYIQITLDSIYIEGINQDKLNKTFDSFPNIKSTNNSQSSRYISPTDLGYSFSLNNFEFQTGQIIDFKDPLIFKQIEPDEICLSPFGISFIIKSENEIIEFQLNEKLIVMQIALISPNIFSSSIYTKCKSIQ